MILSDIFFPDDADKPNGNLPRDYNGQYAQRGRDAEDVVLNYFKRHADHYQIEDLRNSKSWQRVDVDVLVVTLDGLHPLIEIKHCRNIGLTGNVLYETLRVYHDANRPAASVKLGWTARTLATKIAYYNPKTREIWICETSELRRALSRYIRQERIKPGIRSCWVPTDDSTSTFNILIPEKYCADIFEKVHIDD